MAQTRRGQVTDGVRNPAGRGHRRQCRPARSAPALPAAGLAKPSGALVTEVKPGSPAARAGLRVGDIILMWADREVDDRSLPFIVAQTPAGRPTSVTVSRDRAAQQVAVVPDKMPE